MSSLKPKPSSMVTPSWMEPMNALTVSGFTFDLAEVIRDAEEHVLALDPAEVARPVGVPVAVGVVLVVAGPGHGQGLRPVQQLAARAS